KPAQAAVKSRAEVKVTPRNKSPQWGDSVVRERNVRVQPKVNNREVREPYVGSPKQPQVSQRTVRVTPRATPKPQPVYQPPRAAVKSPQRYEKPVKATPRGQVN